MKNRNRGRGYKLTEYVEKVFETPSDKYSEWFGYYNYDTLNSDKSLMLCNRIIKDGSAPQKGDQIELGYYNISQGTWHHIGYSDSWNWQQGAMLQWIPGNSNETSVIYNCSREGHLFSRIHNILNGEDRDIDWPIYALTPNGQKSISIDLERSYWCRAYHYQSVMIPSKNGRVYQEDGIYEIDLNANRRKRIISIQDIINTDYRPYFTDRKHWVEHIMINPSGTRFCFLHRFSSEENVMDYDTRIMIADIDGSNLQCIQGWDSVKWSHFGWCGDDSFAVYTYFPGHIKNLISVYDLFKRRDISSGVLVKNLWYRFVKRLPRFLSIRLGGPYSYYQFYSVDDKGQFLLRTNMDSRETRIDGHPSFTKDLSYMITDTYSDKTSWQRLFVYNLKTRKAFTLARFFAFYDHKPSSCDLHPKLCRDNSYVVVDTAYNNRHHMVLLKIVWERIQGQ